MDYDLDGMTLLVGDARDRLAEIPDASVHTIVTSPPYLGLRDYGDDRQLGQEETAEEYVDGVVSILRDARRALRRDGTLWLNLGDSYVSDGAAASRRPGVSSAVANGHAGGGPSRAAAAAQRSARAPGLRQKNLIGIPWRVAFALQDDGWWLRGEIVWSKTNPMPGSVGDRPVLGHEQIFLLARRPDYFYDVEAVKVPVAGDLDADRRLRTVWTFPTAQYPWAHFATFPDELPDRCIRLATSERGVCGSCAAPWIRVVERGEPELAANTWSAAGACQYEVEKGGVVDRDPTRQGSTLKHVRRVTTLGWEPGCVCGADPVPATVLDPFAGSGTTLAIARRLGRRGIGIELSPDYAAAAVRHRLTRWWRDPPRPRPADETQLALEELVAP